MNVVNPPKARRFKVKRNTQGHPANFSKFVVARDLTVFELHLNCKVRGARDEGIYCVDLAVVPEGIIPTRSNLHPPWICAENNTLVTFLEAKRLQIYPMLLAHFIGIVHEVLPQFLDGSEGHDFEAQGHFPPTLVTLGSYSGNARAIVNAFPDRNLHIGVAPGFDVRLSRIADGEEFSALVSEGPWSDA